MTEPRHIALDELGDLLQGRLCLGASGRVSGHLTTGCAECFADIAFLLRLIHALRPETQSLVPGSMTAIPQGRQALALCAMPEQWADRMQGGMTERVM